MSKKDESFKNMKPKMMSFPQLEFFTKELDKKVSQMEDSFGQVVMNILKIVDKKVETTLTTFEQLFLQMAATQQVLFDTKLITDEDIKAKMKIMADERAQIIEEEWDEKNGYIEADRPAEDKDVVMLGFVMVDAKTKEVLLKEDYRPLEVGMKRFFPEFEQEVVGMKAGEKKQFTTTVSGKLGQLVLDKREVVFDVNVVKVKAKAPVVENPPVGGVVPEAPPIEATCTECKCEEDGECCGKCPCEEPKKE